MALFVWTEALRVGNDFIDGDHKKLIAMVNSFHDAMVQGRGNEVIGRVLNNLVAYTKEHFKREETEMQRIRYASYLTHKREHDKLIRQVVDLQNDFSNGKAMLTITVSKFLKDWLIEHIEKTDKLLALAIQQAGAVEKLRQPG